MRDNLLIVANSEQDANMLYVVRVFVPDTFIYLEIRNRPFIVIHESEIDRVRREAAHCGVISYDETSRRLKKEGVKEPDMAHVIRSILKRSGIRKVTVPENFPLGLAKRLQKLRVKVKPRPGNFFSSRETKTRDEVRKISAALTMAEVGLAEAIHAIKNSRVSKNRRLIYRNSPLTAERLRGIIGTAVMQVGGVAANTIVAVGAQTSDPRERGHGVLKAGEPILLNVFPRSQATGYFGDLARTVVKGRASESMRQMYRAVEEAQDLAFTLLRAGASAGHIHERVHEHFNVAGYKTFKGRGRMHGFLHGVGHGLGLDVHEPIKIEPGSDQRLKESQVVTVEPGLYYPGIGGVRLEDVALVTKRGARNLTRFEKVLEI